MPTQPASGARDLNPQQLEVNHFISKKLSELYHLWGYEEVDPPKIERLETLKAAGAISSKEILNVVADEKLGLRPDMTASIARVASTRFAQKARPLRLWTCGTVFKCRESHDNGSYVEENLQSGVELFGIEDIKAEI